MSKRTIFTTIVIPVLLIIGLISVLTNNPQNPAPELVLAQKHIHFGTLPEWEGPVTQSVTARNTSKNILRIQKVQTGCSYVQITAPAAISPNSEGTLYITVNPELLPTDETSATATIFTDSPRTPIVPLTITAAAKRFATLNPDSYDFGDIRPETTYHKTIILAVHAPLDTSNIHLLPSSHPRLTWEINPDTSIITVQLGPLMDWGRFASLLTVAFPNQRTLTLPVTANVSIPTTENR